MESCSEDWINRLPDELLSRICSYLSMKEAASTSLLSKRWRSLFAFVPNLEFDNSFHKLMKLSTSFPEFVDRILDVRGKCPVDRFFLKVVDTNDPVDPDCLTPWIHYALSRGVSDLHLVIKFIKLNRLSTLTRRIFFTETLVRLRIYINNGLEIDVENVHLPRLKILVLEHLCFKNKEVGFNKLLSGCPLLEELVLDDILTCEWDSFSVSVTTLKRLTCCCSLTWEQHDDFPSNVSFDTPNLVYLDYGEMLTDQYPKVRFDSLVEAKIDLLVTEADEYPEGYEDTDLYGNATNFIMGISNVEKLSITADTLKVLTFCCNAIPVFKNLTHLTIGSKPRFGWDSLPGLLKNCPKLETLVFRGLWHKATDRCGDVCLCNREQKAEDIISCLLSSPVKELKIYIINYEVEKQIEHINHFLATMPHLEQVVLFYKKEVTEVSTQLQRLTRAASPKCQLLVIPIDPKLVTSVPSTTTAL